MTVTMFNNAEGGTNGTTVTTTNAGGTGNSQFSQVIGAVTFATASAAHGSLGFHLVPASGASCRLRWAGFNDLTGALRVYKTSDAVWSVTDAILSVTTSGGSNVISIWATTGGKYNIQGVGGASLATTTNNRAAGDRLEMSWTIGASTTTGSWDFYLYRADSMTVVEHLSGTAMNLGTTAWDRIDWGKTTTSTATNVIDYDDFAAASGTTALFGPVSAVPTAAFTHTEIGLDTVCTDSSTFNSPATSISSWAWTFGDGGTSTVQNPTHTYASAGTYTVGLTVTDNNAQTSTQVTHPVTVTAPGTSASPQTVLGTTSGFTTQAGSTTAANILSATTDTSSGSPVTTTWAWSGSGAELDFGQISIAPPSSGQPLVCTIYCDRLNSTSGTLAAQLVEGTTTRSSLTGIAIPDMTASGGSGTTSTGTVAGVVELIFPWTDVQSVVDWNQLILKLQVTTA